MKQLFARYVEATQAGDYFQVSFEKTRDSLKDYFLIQWGFEEEEETRDEPYIESDDIRFCGWPGIKKVELNQNRFHLLLADDNELEIKFDIPDKEYIEVKRILKTILAADNFLCND